MTTNANGLLKPIKLTAKKSLSPLLKRAAGEILGIALLFSVFFCTVKCLANECLVISHKLRC